MRTDALVGNASTLTDTLEEQVHAIFRQRQARLGEKQVSFSRAAPLRQFLLVRSMAIKVVEQVAQAVVAQGNAPLLGTLALHNQETPFAVEITVTEITELGESNTRIVE